MPVFHRPVEIGRAPKQLMTFGPGDMVFAEGIRESHQKSTVERVKQQGTILAIQDTTELNFTTHRSKKGMGHLDSRTSRGLKVHSVFCASSSGVPLGVLNQQVWARDISTLGKKHYRHKREIKDKESRRWLEALSSTEAEIPEAVRIVSVADCEADIDEFLAQKRRENSHVLIRAYHNRSVKSANTGEKLQSAIGKAPAQGVVTIELPKNPLRSTRQATLTLRSSSVEIQPPPTHINYKLLKPIQVQVIKAEEENPPTGVSPISWLLLTTLTVTGFTDVVQCLRWYSYRWLIECYSHFN